MGDHSIEPQGPFSLAAARDFAGGFAAGIGGGAATGTSLVMAFPVEPRPATADAWGQSAIVELRQGERDGPVHARVAPAGDEAAASFVIGQRMARTQAARIKTRLAEQAGDELELDGARFRAFPRPERLLEVDGVDGLADEKVRRLHGLAEAALDGRLDTNRLRSFAPTEALAQLRELRGVGDFTSQGILLRVCGLADELPDDALSDEVLAAMYADALSRGLTRDEIVARWKPYRMWATVLLRVGWGRGIGKGQSYRR